jgi:uncharacterized repeat protein (TIGR03803 family)
MRFGKLISLVGHHVILVTVLAVGATESFGQTEQILYRFKGSSDSGHPSAGLVADKSGNLYGTNSGFQIDCGTVFELEKPTSVGSPWTENILHSFSCDNDGTPYDALIFDAAGNLYGTTFFNSMGSVFELSPPATQGGAWTETVLHSFTAKNGDGGGSVASLVMDKAGNLYGTTENGGILSGNCNGSDGCGVVFEFEPPTAQGGSWTEVILYSFHDRNDGKVPAAGVTLDQSGDLYGTTFYGGPANLGTVFKLVAPSAPGDPWKEHVLYTFTGEGDGGAPAANLILRDNNLYGTAEGTSADGNCAVTGGCGVVFELSPPSGGGKSWVESTLYAFTAGTDGRQPIAPVIFDKAGNLYTTTSFGGGTAQNGIVAELSPPSTQGDPWTESVLWRFEGGSDGSFPAGGLILDPSGNLYSTTYIGGDGYGTVFRVKP